MTPTALPFSPTQYASIADLYAALGTHTVAERQHAAKIMLAREVVTYFDQQVQRHISWVQYGGDTLCECYECRGIEPEHKEEYYACAKYTLAQPAARAEMVKELAA